jgi:hypothetical protein
MDAFRTVNVACQKIIRNSIVFLFNKTSNLNQFQPFDDDILWRRLRIMDGRPDIHCDPAVFKLKIQSEESELKYTLTLTLTHRENKRE